jgi:hypothetical protein
MPIRSRLISALCLLLSISSGVVFAQANIHSVSLEELKVSYTLPSGAEESKALYPVGSTMGVTDVPTDRKTQKLNITVSNGSGATLARGTVQDDRNYVLMPSGQGFQLLPSGNYSRGSGSIYPGIVIVNALPEGYKVDLFGMNGKHGIKDARVSRSFDLANANKTSPEEDRYRMVITGPDGTQYTDTEHAHAGSFMVIHKTYNGPIGASRAGYIDSRAAKK